MRRRAGIFEFAGFHGDILQLGPAQQVTIVHPLSNYTYRAHYTAFVRVDFIGGRSDVVSAAGSHGLD